jgi:hypothetical protein
MKKALFLALFFIIMTPQSAKSLNDKTVYPIIGAVIAIGGGYCMYHYFSGDTITENKNTDQPIHTQQQENSQLKEQIEANALKKREEAEKLTPFKTEEKNKSEQNPILAQQALTLPQLEEKTFNTKPAFALEPVSESTQSKIIDNFENLKKLLNKDLNGHFD